MNTNFRFEQTIIRIILLSGVIISLFQFVYNRSLEVDESMLALNIINRNAFELLIPLDLNQVAPILFLLLEKLFSILIPNSEYGLRLLPLLSFWLSIFFFYKILKKVVKNHYTIIFALSLFVFNSTFLFYSSQVKQYMSDVFVLTSIYYFTLKTYNKEQNKYLILGILGGLSIFLSNISPIVLFSIGVYLLYYYFTGQRKHFISILSVSLFWAFTFLLYYYYFVYAHPSRGAMTSYWSKVIPSFMPHNPLSLDFYNFVVYKFQQISNSLFYSILTGQYILLVLLLIGFFELIIKRKFDVLILLFIPLSLHLLLSSLQLYPFDLRLILYALPVIIIIISFGFDYLINLFFNDLKIERLRPLAILTPLFFLFTLLLIKLPFKCEEIKKSINYIQKNIKKSDKIYVYYGSENAFKYYNDIHYIKPSVPIIKGTEHRNNNDAYISELKNLEGRNWLLFSHIYYNEEAFIIEKLDSIGYNKIETFNAFGSSAYLYDFKKLKLTEDLK